MKKHAALTPQFTVLLLTLILSTVFFPSKSQAQTPQPSPKQGSMEVSMVVRDNRGKPLADTEVEFIEIQSRQRVLKTLDKEGQLKHTFDTGHFWQINIRQIRGYFYWQFEVVPGKRLRMTRTMTYDFARYARETRPAVDRSKLRLKTEQQKHHPETRGDAQSGIVRLQIRRPNGQPLINYPVQITCYDLGKSYATKTNAAGWAVYKVPLDKEYEVDIDGIESYAYVDVPNQPGYRGTKKLTYEPTLVEEKTVRDTTTQTLAASQKGSSGAVIVHVTVKGGTEGLWKNEEIYLEVLGEKRWYRGTTNSSGKVTFLLPKGKAYMIHGRFEPDIDVIDLRRRRGIGYSNKGIVYRPNPKYQYPDRYIPTPEQLIVDAFSNYLTKKFPPLADKSALQTHAEWMSPVNADSKEAVLRLAFAAGEDPDKTAVPALNLALVMDKSGSMAGHDRIGQLQSSLAELVRRLRPIDKVSLVIFEDFETVVIPVQELGTDKQLFIETVQRIEAGGGTNIYKGLEAGYKEIRKNYKKNGTNRVILLSDGFGSTPVDKILEMQAHYTAQGLECSTVGVGEDYNFALLTQLATQGGGHIEHVGDARGMTDAFLRQLNSVLFPVAKNATVEVIYNKHLKYKQLYGFPVKERTGNRLKIKLKNVYSGLDQIAFLRFELQNATKEIEDMPVTVRIRYQDMRTNDWVEQEMKVALTWSKKSGALAMQVDQQEQKLYAMAVMNQSLKVMSDKFHSGDAPAARKALKDGLASLEKATGQEADKDLRELRREIEGYLEILEKIK